MSTTIRDEPLYAGLFDDVARRATRYLEGIGDRAVVPDARAVDELSGLGGALPSTSSSAHEVLELLDRLGSPATVATTGGRFFGMVTGGALPASVAASWLVSAWDQNAVLRQISPAAVVIEDIALEWTRALLGLSEGCAGAIVTGATMANFTALAAARQAVLRRAGWNVEDQGLFGAPPVEVVVGDEVHVSVIKALGMLGLGRKRVHRVPVDSQGRMRADRLPRFDDRTIVCVQAGNVNTGAFDPAEEICARAGDAGAWVHVDGAFGLWAAASPRYAHLTAGFSEADSWATDAHKWANAVYDCGIVYVRNRDALRDAMTVSAAYAATGDAREPWHHNPEMSRRARGVELWATLRSLGRQGLASIVERTCGHARRFADGLRAAGFTVLNDVVINQVLVSFGSPELTRAVIARLQQGGVCWFGGTEWQGHVAMRISVSSWATTSEDVESSLLAIRRAVDDCRPPSSVCSP